MSFFLTNIKVSISCTGESLDTVESKCLEKKLKFKRYNNFIVFHNHFVYTIFKSKIGDKKLKNHVNITKINCKEDIFEALVNLNILDFNISNENLKVDNITGSLDLKKEIIIENLISYVKSGEFKSPFDILISYNNELFPSVFFKVKKDNVKIGTISLFHSGKVNFVGCRKLKDLECLSSLILALTNMK